MSNSFKSYILHIFRTNMVFTRPPCVPIPTIWHKFTVKRGDTLIPLRVQDLTEDTLESAIALLNQYYNRDEIASKCIDVLNHPVALAELDRFWRGIAGENLSLVCLLDLPGSEEVVAFNCLDVVCQDDPYVPWKSEDRASQLLFGTYELVSRSYDVFARYGVDKYLNANGLVVHPDWRRLDIAVEVLNARTPLCRALGIKVTATVFTSFASQAVAKKAGYVTLSEVTYEEMAQLGLDIPGISDNSPSSKLMAHVIE